MLDLVFQNRFSTLLQGGNIGLIKQELAALFRTWETAQLTQRWVEKLLHQLLKLIQRQIINISESEINHIEYQLNEILLIPSNMQILYEKFWKTIEYLIISDPKDNDNVIKVLNSAELFIKSHYSEQMNIEDLSRKFNFNTSYLTMGNPSITRASEDTVLPPAIVLVQDKDNKMLVNHNFVYDMGLFVPGDADNDPGFYVNIPGGK